MNKHGGYYGDDREDVLDFSVNINPLGPPKSVLACLEESLAQIHRYPEIEGAKHKELLAKRLGIEPEEVMLGNGGIELIYLYARAMAHERALIIQPTFNEYERAFRLARTEVYHHVLQAADNFQVDLARLHKQIRQVKPDVIVLCNPNNPTGSYLSPSGLAAIFQKASGCHFFIDESFVDFGGVGMPWGLIKEYPVFVLRSMTKFYAMPGIRLGYGVANSKIIAQMRVYKEPWTVNQLALKALACVVDDEEYLKTTKEWFRTEKDYLYRRLMAIRSIQVFPSHCNFHLIKYQNAATSVLQSRLLQAGIYIRTCEDFVGLGGEFYRMAVKTREDNQRLLAALTQI
ncbi:MAG: threonine-phosphate decarboxylase CobD [Limnochordia bacterium]|nr:threonine-phosphate decarboxylase CobD [Limnochordia bacterium]